MLWDNMFKKKIKTLNLKNKSSSDEKKTTKLPHKVYLKMVPQLFKISNVI